MRRKDREITDRGEIDGILRSNSICHLGMVDGHEPYVVPLVYGYDGDSLYFHSAAEGRKIDVLRRNDRVCFEVCGPFTPAEVSAVCRRGSRFVSVIGSGTASFVSDPGERGRAMDVIMRQQYGTGSEKIDEAKFARVLIIRVKVETVSGKRS